MDKKKDAAYIHKCLHNAFKVKPLRNEVDDIIGFEDIDRVPHRQESHSDRLLDHYLYNEDELKESCSCIHYRKLLKHQVNVGTKFPSYSMTQRLAKKV